MRKQRLLIVARAIARYKSLYNIYLAFLLEYL